MGHSYNVAIGYGFIISIEQAYKLYNEEKEEEKDDDIIEVREYIQDKYEVVLHCDTESGVELTGILVTTQTHFRGDGRGGGHHQFLGTELFRWAESMKDDNKNLLTLIKKLELKDVKLGYHTVGYED
jgi:hypothetical protein